MIEIRDLRKYFSVPRVLPFGPAPRPVRAVDGVSFDIRRGETLGLVGESGSGKTTVGRMLLRLRTPTSGTISIDGADLFGLRGEASQRVRRRVQMVFQDPMASINPRMRVEAILAEPLQIQGGMTRAEVRRRASELLDLVGLPLSALGRYAHEFSGGQRQRIGIARALALEPDLVVCDEAIASLDVSIQAQIVNLLVALQRRLGLTFLFISHDLRMVRHISDRIAVMYLGKLMEIGDAQELYETPRHPYTQTLLSAAPVFDPPAGSGQPPLVITGDPPSPSNPPSGCVFHTRCPRAEPLCAETVPLLRPLGPTRSAACHFA